MPIRSHREALAEFGKLVIWRKTADLRNMDSKMLTVSAAMKLPCPVRKLVSQGHLPGCFAAGTPVMCDFGSKRIETIVKGDRVWSRDENDPDGPLELKEVEEVFVRESLLWKLRVGNVTIETTSEHPFWVVGKGWRNVNEMVSGDRLVGPDGQEVMVREIVETNELVTVYNFRVADHHTYFVGDSRWGFEVWTHNAGYGSNAAAGAKDPGVAQLTLQRG